MFARERRRGLVVIDRVCRIEHANRNGLPRALPSSPLPMRELASAHNLGFKSQSRWFRIIPRRNFIQAKPIAGALSPQIEVPAGAKPRRLPRRKALYEPSTYESIEFDFNNGEEIPEQKPAALNSSVGVVRHDNDDEWSAEHHQNDALTEKEEGKISVVEAYYAAKTIDLARLIMSNLTADATRKKYNRNNLLLELSPSSATSEDNPSYVAVYRFGSVIFFNVSPRVQLQILQSIKRFATEPQAKGFEQKDSFGVCIMPNASQTRVTPEHCIVPQLNMNAVAVISEVMAQSVALESYNEMVDSLLDNFAVLNSKISTTSNLDLDKKMLFSKIAQNNHIFIDLISKLRIKGRSQIAWDQGEYEVIHSGMTMEFDIDDRFELIQFKLDLIQQNSKLFLEVIQHQKSASLEYIIVVLISFECVLMCLEMSGQGAVLFEGFKSLLS